MSRLDRHVAVVQNKLVVQKFLDGLCRALPFAVIVGFLVRLLSRQTTLTLNQKTWWLGGLGAAAVIAIAYAIRRRPSSHDAAVAIDQRLGLKEKFSTALSVRNLNDPFAMAAVRDAERTADNVSLHKRFPLAPPAQAGYKVWIALAVLAAVTLIMPRDYFKRQEAAKNERVQIAQANAAKKSVQEAIAKVETIAKAFPNDESVAVARKELEKLLTVPSGDVTRINRSAAETLSNLDKEIKNHIAKSKEAAVAANNEKMLKGLMPPADDKGPVAEAHRALAKGETAEAMKHVGDAVKKFDQMSQEEKEKAAQQMAALQKQLAAQANNPQAQQQMQQQLQQMGANPQQAQQMAQQMQQAAAGDKQAQQQLAQQAQQMMQQMNNGQGPTQQQQQQAQQMMQQMQAQANSQMQAGQMAQAAQQMAQAMQQGAAQQQGGQGQQNQQGQAGNNQQQMADAAQDLQQQMANLQAVASDAAQQQAAGQAAQQAAADAAGQVNNPGDGPGQNGQGKNGEWAQGDPAGQKGQGQGGPGQANGGGTGKEEAPYAVKQEVAPVQTDEKGKFIASYFVNAGSLKGESKAELQKITAAAEREATDDVDSERITGEAKKAVKGYFGQMSGEQKN